jgi:SAM-dependent methyltransferase
MEAKGTNLILVNPPSSHLTSLFLSHPCSCPSPSGGFTERDEMGLSTNLFDYMLGPFTIKSIIDVGCGKGVSTKEFLDRGARVLCVEGSHDGVQQSLLPSDLIVEHDFSRGPWWPEETFDAAWSVEFLEHVGRPFMMNYLPIFKKSALLFVTSSGFGGWHHVEVHAHWWWRARFEAQGFVFSQELTDLARKIASDGVSLPGGQAQHLIHGLRVFINPEVASLPQHHHLFGGGGCYDESIDNNHGGKECEGVDELTGQYLPLLNCRWNPEARVKVLKCEKNPKATIPNQKPLG